MLIRLVLPIIKIGNFIVASEIGFYLNIGIILPVSKRLGALLYISSKALYLFICDLLQYKKILLYYSMSL